MKFTLTKRNLLFFAFMSFYASCGREDIFDHQNDLVALKHLKSTHQIVLEGETDGPNPLEKIIKNDWHFRMMNLNHSRKPQIPASV
jgi:hypothetical protein